ncbi:hypothetical protein DK419_05480 [Methylobacterium terrae]|uniref:CYTH domain-containing protein n=1 Tax=Methylobacterium terrae TaxID=2202827 RepID=A0A2U8WHW8_9HYPH|nr:hypothetical protein [Methylobacterium terrae]AWN45834.1 hypothetical protein DK419_05480 [Methylobacterium terrae]
MTLVRRFQVAPALVRLIRKERGSSRITEGYFPPQSGRTSFVRVDGGQCHLVLVTSDNGASSEERTEVPRAHGDALLDVCAGRAAYDRTQVALGNGCDALIDRYVAPGNVDVVTVVFDNPDEASGFPVPPWFGPEVSADQAYEGRSIALQGVPHPGEIALSNAALDAVLDLIEPRYGFGRYAAPSRNGEETGVVNALRRIATPPAPEPAPPPPEPEPVHEPVHQAVHEPAPPQAEASPETAPPPLPPEPHPDTRIDDVIESLSQALGAAVPGGDAARDDGTPAFERWTVRPRRTQPTP